MSSPNGTRRISLVITLCIAAIFVVGCVALAVTGHTKYIVYLVIAAATTAFVINFSLAVAGASRAMREAREHGAAVPTRDDMEKAARENTGDRDGKTDRPRRLFPDDKGMRTAEATVLSCSASASGERGEGAYRIVLSVDGAERPAYWATFLLPGSTVEIEYDPSVPGLVRIVNVKE